jgi:hypothetical protein
MNKETVKEKNSTVAISPDIVKKLEVFCKGKGITKKDFISLSLSYFERYNIDPVKDESPITEMEKIRKRLDQVIAFIRTQEKNKINPMFEAITTTETRIKKDLDSVAKIENLKAFSERLGEVFVTLSNKQKEENGLMKESLNKLANGMYIIAKGLEENKDRTGLGDKIKNLFKQ